MPRASKAATANPFPRTSRSGKPHSVYVPATPGGALRQPSAYDAPLPAPILLVKGESGRGVRPQGAVGAQRLDVAFDYLFGLKSDPVQVAVVDEGYWFDYLVGMGAPSILEAISGGRLPAEIAISNRVPLTFFKKWLNKRINTDDLSSAMETHAEVCVIKAQLVLLADVGSPQEAAMKRDLSQQLKWQAERAHSEAWGPPGKSEPAPPALVFNINWGGGSATSGGPTIEAQALRPAAPSFDPFALPLSISSQYPLAAIQADSTVDTLEEASYDGPPSVVSDAAFVLAALPPFHMVFGHSPRDVGTSEWDVGTSERVRNGT